MTALVVPVPVPVSALPLPDPADLGTWPTRMKELHRWMRNDAAVFISALGEAAYQNALHAVAMADSASGAANFKGAWSDLTGALNMPASVSHSGRLWLLTANLANVATATPGVSGSWLDVSNFLMGVSTASAARTALDVYSKAEALALAPAKNLIDNSNFSINQRAVSGTVVLTAGAYGHDRFKAGASGCTYTFATVAGVTTLTISAGSLIHVVRSVNLRTGTHVLSWNGTAQGKIGAGSYAATGVTGSVTGGSNLTLEFGTGTLSQPKLEAGATPTAWRVQDDWRACLAEFEICRVWFSYPSSNTGLGGSVTFKAVKSSTPNITRTGNYQNVAEAGTNANSITINEFVAKNANNSTQAGGVFEVSCEP